MATAVSQSFDGSFPEISNQSTAHNRPLSAQVQSLTGTTNGEVLLTMTNIGWAGNLTLRASGTILAEVSFDGSNWIAGGFFREASASGYSYVGSTALDGGVFFLNRLAPTYPNIRFKEDGASGSFVQVNLSS